MPDLRVLWTDVTVAGRNLVRHWQRTVIGIVVVAAGVASLIVAAGFIEWIYWAMREGTIRSNLGHIQIARAEYFKSGANDPFALLLSDASPLLGRIRAMPGVETVSPRLGFSGLASRGDSTLSFLAEALDPGAEKGLTDSVVIGSGRDLRAGERGKLTMGLGLASSLGAKVGDQIVLLVNTRSGGVNGRELTLVGIFTTATKAYDDVALRLSLEDARDLLRVNGAHKWIVLLASTDQTQATLETIRPWLDRDGLNAVPWQELADFYTKTVSLFSKQVGVMKLIIAIVMVLAVANVLIMAVLQRTTEIGTSMALGVRRVQIMRRFLFEGLLLGLLGAAVGLVVGAVAAHIISAIGVPMPPPPGMARGFTGQVLLTVELALDALALAIAVTLLAGLYPAWRASRLNVVDALRYNR